MVKSLWNAFSSTLRMEEIPDPRVINLYKRADDSTLPAGFMINGEVLEILSPEGAEAAIDALRRYYEHGRGNRLSPELHGLMIVARGMHETGQEAV